MKYKHDSKHSEITPGNLTSASMSLNYEQKCTMKWCDYQVINPIEAEQPAYFHYYLGLILFFLSGRFQVNTSIMDKNIAQQIIHAFMTLQLGMLLLGSRYACIASVFLNFLIFIPFLIGFTICVSPVLLPPPPFFYSWFIGPLTLNSRCTQHTAWCSKCQMSGTGALDIHLVVSSWWPHLNSGMLRITLGI